MSKTRAKLTKAVWAVIPAVAIMLSGCGGEETAGGLETGDSYLITGEYPAAVASYRSVESDSVDQKLQIRLATALLKDGYYNQALSELDKIPQPGARAQYLRSLCCLRLGDVALAQNAVEQSLQANPDDPLALSLLARIRFLQKQYQLSGEAYQRALSLSSDEQMRTSLYYNLAMSQLMAGNFRDADTTFNQYLARQNYITREDNRIAGAIAYSVGDHARAYRHWKNLSARERKQVLDTIVDESAVYQQLAAVN